MILLLKSTENEVKDESEFSSVFYGYYIHV